MSPFIISPESSVHKNIKLLAITGLPIMLTYSAYFLCRLIKLLLDCEKQEFSLRQIKNDTFISLTFGAQEAQQPRDSFSGHRWYQGPCLHIFCEANTRYYYITHQYQGLVSIYSVTQNYRIEIFSLPWPWPGLHNWPLYGLPLKDVWRAPQCVV